MICEEQQYRVQVGKVPALMEAYESRGMTVLRRHLGTLVGCWSTELGGDMDVMVQIWAFEDLADRQRRRTRLAADPEWTAFATDFGHLITERRMRLLVPADFSPPIAPAA